MGKNKSKKTKEKIQEQKRKKQEQRRQFSRKKAKNQYGDSGWKQEFTRFSDQMKVLGLRIKDVAGDGNCLFRSIADQVYGNVESHATVRAAIVGYMKANREDFEPFVEDDVPFDTYISRMGKNATWGGNMEIQAASQLYRVNITIHQLNMPRWEIAPFPDRRSIHLSYHDGDHYSSVRSIGEPDYGIPKAVVFPTTPVFVRKDVDGEDDEDNDEPPSDNEKMIMESTLCYDLRRVRRTLREQGGHLPSTIEILVAQQTPSDWERSYRQTEDPPIVPVPYLNDPPIVPLPYLNDPIPLPDNGPPNTSAPIFPPVVFPSSPNFPSVTTADTPAPLTLPSTVTITAQNSVPPTVPTSITTTTTTNTVTTTTTTNTTISSEKSPTSPHTSTTTEVPTEVEAMVMEMTGHSLKVVRNTLRDFNNDVTASIDLLLMLDASTASVDDTKPKTTISSVNTPTPEKPKNDDWKKNFSAADFGDGGFLLSGANRPESGWTPNHSDSLGKSEEKARKQRERKEALRERVADCPPDNQHIPGGGKGRRKGEPAVSEKGRRRGQGVHVLTEDGAEEPPGHQRKKKGEQTPLERLQELRDKGKKTNKERQEHAKLEKLYGAELDALNNPPPPPEEPAAPPGISDLGSLKI